MTSPELMETQKQLKELFDEKVLTYDKANECQISIENKVHDKIIFIVERKIARTIVYSLHDLPQIYRILIYSITEEEENEEWMKYCPKIQFIIFTPELLIENVAELMDQKLEKDREEEQRKRFGVSSQRILWLEDLENTPLVCLESSVEPLQNIIPNLSMSVRVAKNKIEKPADGLTIDESAAIRIYETGGLGLYQRLCVILNRALITQDRHKVQPYLYYLKLLLTALWKLPSFQGTVWHEVKVDVSNEYQKGKKGIWWEITSTKIDSRTLQRRGLFGQSNHTNMFSIQCESGKSTKKHAYSPLDEEILLLPGFQYEVLDIQQINIKFHIITLKEIDSEFPLISPSFDLS